MRLALCRLLETSFDICEGLILLSPYLQKSEALLDKTRIWSKLSDFFLHYLPAVPFNLWLIVKYLTVNKALKQVVERGGGCPIPGSIQSQIGQSSEQDDLVEERGPCSF